MSTPKKLTEEELTKIKKSEHGMWVDPTKEGSYQLIIDLNKQLQDNIELKKIKERSEETKVDFTKQQNNAEVMSQNNANSEKLLKEEFESFKEKVESYVLVKTSCAIFYSNRVYNGGFSLEPNIHSKRSRNTMYLLLFNAKWVQKEKYFIEAMLLLSKRDAFYDFQTLLEIGKEKGLNISEILLGIKDPKFFEQCGKLLIIYFIDNIEILRYLMGLRNISPNFDLGNAEFNCTPIRALMWGFRDEKNIREIVELLCNMGIDFNTCDSSGGTFLTPIDLNISEAHYKFFEIMLRLGANPLLLNKKHDLSPLNALTRCSDSREVIRLLVKYGAGLQKESYHSLNVLSLITDDENEYRHHNWEIIFYSIKKDKIIFSTLSELWQELKDISEASSAEQRRISIITQSVLSADPGSLADGIFDLFTKYDVKRREKLLLTAFNLRRASTLNDACIQEVLSFMEPDSKIISRCLTGSRA